jgi:hypothetical protein
MSRFKHDQTEQLGAIGEPDTEWYSGSIDGTGSEIENRSNSEISKEMLPLWSGYPLGFWWKNELEVSRETF